MDLVDFIYLFAFILRACGEFLWSTLAFWRTVRDRTELYYIDSPRNAQILAACPSLQTFTPWRCAAGPRIQTVLAKCCMPRAKQPYRQELVTLSDGVCVRLDWKEHSSTEATAPICFIAHGLGGDSDSPYAAVLAEECAKRGWRAVVYLRRGHGKFLCTLVMKQLRAANTMQQTYTSDATSGMWKGIATASSPG
jgi:predicted alpha/beta-fold hydrolase